MLPRLGVYAPELGAYATGLGVYATFVSHRGSFDPKNRWAFGYSLTVNPWQIKSLAALTGSLAQFISQITFYI